MRFPEFSEEWERTTISNYGTVVTGNTPPTSHTNYFGGDFLWASPADLGSSKYIKFTNKTLTPSGMEKVRIVPKGSVLVTCIGSTIGKMGMAYEEMSTNQQINTVVVRENFDNNFVYYNILSSFPKYLKEVSIQAVPILSKSNFERLITWKTNYAEQEKIGKFLSLIDEKIETQNKIIEDLNQLMSVICDKLFFNLKGHKRVLSDISDIIKGQQINSDCLLEQGLYYVMNGGIEPSGYYNSYNAPKDTISISEGGNSCGYIQYNNELFWSGGHCYTLQNLVKDISTHFLFYFLKWKEGEIMKLRVGGALPNIQKKDLAKVIITVPSLEIQHSIEAKLKTIQNKINLEKTIFRDLTSLRTFLLSNMLI